MRDTDLDVNVFARMIVDALESADIEYMLGGAIAASWWGQPRSTNDVDIVIYLPDEKIEAFSAELWKREMMVPPDIIRENIADTRGDLPINAIHPFSGNKAEFFPLRGNDPLRKRALERKQLVELPAPIGRVYIHAPEDLILYKLHYYAISRQTKHNRDIAAILTSGVPVDREYIGQWAGQIGLAELWAEFKDL